MLLAVMLAMRESEEDWLALGRKPDGPWPSLPAAGRRRRRPPGSTTRSSNVGQRRTVSAARFTASGICWRSCPSASESASAPLTRRRSTRPTRSTMASWMRELIGELTDTGYHAAAVWPADDLKDAA